MSKNLTDIETWELIKPVCRELYELVDTRSIKFVSGTLNENNGTCEINLKSNRLHFASRGLKDSIGDISYEHGKIRIGLRANGIPANVFVQLE
ncbi:MAG: hypothetical protein M3Z01_01460 [Thermoproteota archaeon]|nr:hypothetical protein [Thermoproteota archaeon]